MYKPYDLGHDSFLYYVGDDWRSDWCRLSAWAKRGLDKIPSYRDTNDLYRALDTLENRLWRIQSASGKTKAFITTRVTESSYGRTGHIDLAVGRNLDDWIDVVNFYKLYFKSLDCKNMQVEGRRGWIKLLQDYGLSERAVTLEVSLNG